MGSGRGSLTAVPTAESSPATSASGDGGRAFGLGPRRAVRVTGAALILVALAALVGVALSSSHGASATHAQPAGYTARAGTSSSAAVAATHNISSAKYGGLPSWLPQAKTPVNRVVTATAAHPALAIQGDTLAVDLAGGRVLATAVGPQTPEQGRFPVPATSPCTFIVTFAHASGVIPLNARAFTFIDELGHVRHPRVTAIGAGALPRQILPGKPVSLKVYDILPTGDGGLTWAPDGGRPIASWDFDVEID
jgi:hypothetical protein